MPPCSEGCFFGLQTLLRSRRSECREPAGGLPEADPHRGPSGSATDDHHRPPEIERKVRETLAPHLATLQEAMLHELECAVGRLGKAPAADLATASHSFERAISAETCPEKSVKVSTGSQWYGRVLQDIRPIKRAEKRRWTTSMSNIGGALAPAILVSPLEDIDTPVTSTVVSAAPSEVASDESDSSKMSKRPSLREAADGSRQSHRKTTRITFEGLEQLNAMDRQADRHEDESDEEPFHHKTMCHKRTGSDTSSVGRKSDASSMNWRADALDVGEFLAAEAAAKKGHTSVDSIVALVEAERERWEEERQVLEARVSELQEQVRSMQVAHSPDAEKQALKKEHQELRKVMKARSRFGAWVCARHMMESDDEETDAEKEELRRKMSEMSVQLRRARAAVGAASSESDVSPNRRSHDPVMRH
mmetsp:Transcript_37912/g.67639  ORF Transcript_37912/g.67639 Transcript_37912/m.67639 type:complete len:420 (+) Transcript_37912:46-1305(+)